MNYKQEIIKSMDFLGSKENTIFIGYGLGKTTNKGAGFLKNIPEDKVLETPVAENLMVGLGIGMSLEGYNPIIVFERFDFILNALDAIVNHLDKLDSISRGEFKTNIIIRCIVGGKESPFFTGTTHTQDFTEALQKMIKSPVIKLNKIENIFSIYKNAYNNGIWIIVEEKDKYDCNC